MIEDLQTLIFSSVFKVKWKYVIELLGERRQVSLCIV